LERRQAGRLKLALIIKSKMGRAVLGVWRICESRAILSIDGAGFPG
jgi:hypothetical protein